MSETERLSAAQYLLVITFRRSGDPVPTPVWVVRDGDALAVWTPAESGKVRRIRRNRAVRLAPCDARGNPTGEETAGHAEVLDAAGSRRVRELIAQRYGIFGRLTLLGSRLRRGTDGTVGVRITPQEITPRPR